jgi:DNA-directed RNA polymerase subunit M/transcription elongation factor TFIIS
MTDKIPCKYCGSKYHPRKIKKHELECKNDQKDAITSNKPKAFPKGCMIRICPKCGGETGVFVLDGAKCKDCGADL